MQSYPSRFAAYGRVLGNGTSSPGYSLGIRSIEHVTDSGDYVLTLDYPAEATEIVPIVTSESRTHLWSCETADGGIVTVHTRTLDEGSDDVSFNFACYAMR